MQRDIPNTPDEAIGLGLFRYFTGHPCRNGHIEPRLTKNGECLACRRKRKRRRLIQRLQEPAKNLNWASDPTAA